MTQASGKVGPADISHYVIQRSLNQSLLSFMAPDDVASNTSSNVVSTFVY